MTTVAKSLLLTLRTDHWIDDDRRPAGIQELRELGMVKFHHPMNAWFITDSGKVAANKFQSQLERNSK